MELGRSTSPASPQEPAAPAAPAAVRTRSERVPEAAILSAVGGFLDAYVFIVHGGVFANAQTGNVVLFGVQAASGDWEQALRHLPPLGAFLAGMATVEVLARARGWRWARRPTRVVLLVEMLVFVVVGLLPAGVPDVVPVVLVAWAATLQVGTFRTVGTVSYNTTFTTGNLRSLVSEAAVWLVDRRRSNAPRALALLTVVVSFAGGAVAGGFASSAFDTFAVLLTLPALSLVLVSVVRTTRRRELRVSRGTAPSPSGPGSTR